MFVIWLGERNSQAGNYRVIVERFYSFEATMKHTDKYTHLRFVEQPSFVLQTLYFALLGYVYNWLV